MFSSEIVAHICAFLDLSDIVSLRQTSRQLRNNVPETLVHLQLLEECPFYQLKYSQWNSWTCAASHFVQKRPPVFSDKLDCPSHIDQLLPTDFYCLCKDIERTFAWDYNDKGIVFQDKLLDLTETASSTSLPRCRDGLIRVAGGKQAVSYNGIKVGVLGKLTQSRHSSKAVAVLSELENSTLMAVQFRDGGSYAFKTTTTPPYRLQVTGDFVLLHEKKRRKLVSWSDHV